MIDYKKILNEVNFDDAEIEVEAVEGARRVDIGGNKKGLLYLACRLLEFLEENLGDSDFAELNLDNGISLADGSWPLCIYMFKPTDGWRAE